MGRVRSFMEFICKIIDTDNSLRPLRAFLSPSQHIVHLLRMDTVDVPLDIPIITSIDLVNAPPLLVPSHSSVSSGSVSLLSTMRDSSRSPALSLLVDRPYTDNASMDESALRTISDMEREVPKAMQAFSQILKCASNAYPVVCGPMAAARAAYADFFHVSSIDDPKFIEHMEAAFRAVGVNPDLDASYAPNVSMNRVGSVAWRAWVRVVTSPTGACLFQLLRLLGGLSNPFETNMFAPVSHFISACLTTDTALLGFARGFGMV
jgi:hypothetical protein